MNITTAYEDNDLLVLNKPAGLITHPKNISDTQESATDWLIERFPKIKNVGEPFIASGKEVPRAGIVHRLDKDTSGLLIVAKNNEVFFYLKSLFQERKIKKYYLALVNGRPKNPTRVCRNSTRPGEFSLMARATSGRNGREASSTTADTVMSRMRLANS